MAPYYRRRKLRSQRVIYLVAIFMLLLTLVNVLLLHYHMPLHEPHTGLRFSNKIQHALIRRDHGSLEEVLQVMKRLLKGRWDLQHPHASTLKSESLTLDTKVRNSTLLSNLNAATEANSTLDEEGRLAMTSETIQPGNVGILLKRNMSSILLDGFKHSDLLPRKSGAACKIPSNGRAACNEKQYTILAVSTSEQPNLRRIFLNVLKWLHNPSVAGIRLILSQRTSKMLPTDGVYGNRLLAWQLRDVVQIAYADQNKSAWQIASGFVLPTRALAWRDAETSLLSTRNGTNTLDAGMEQWKESPTELVAPSVFVTNLKTTAESETLVLPHWNGLFHDRGWLCLLRTSPLQGLSWEDAEHAMFGMLLFLGHVQNMGTTYYSAMDMESSSVYSDVGELFGGLPVELESWGSPAYKTCT